MEYGDPTTSASFHPGNTTLYSRRKSGCFNAISRACGPVVHTPMSQRCVKPFFCQKTNSSSGTVASVMERLWRADNSFSQQRVLI